MAKLIFNSDELLRIVDHSLAAPMQSEQTVDYDMTTGKAVTKPVGAPSIILVHDQGVYLMSNGIPADLLDGKGDKRFVVYAKSCHPTRDAHWHDNARALVGGDDFAEVLPWAGAIKQQIAAGAKRITIELTESGIELIAAPLSSNGSAR